MLKALEISGFKSFADKTRFEFPPGITVVVGPNGSGKSNIVDAIKWVLGEQSAKSLRGKDMSDVIFKGSSGAGARKPANAATATIVLENTDRRFPFDADEVHVGRRVYRSGETEYLINGETSRLKDIKNLFRGTGVGTDAYSLIEQGKVDRLLQASAKDRRAIFEEAAGISRFKAKKIEAQRRLVRVDANLIRLADIVEEVGARFRSVKAQASKAARYKEYSERLQQLRTYVGMKDWRTFSEKLKAIEDQDRDLVEQTAALEKSIETDQARAKQLEDKLELLGTDLLSHQENASRQRDKITQISSRISLNESRVEDLRSRREQMKEQLEKSEAKTAEFRNQAQKTESELEKAELDYRSIADELTGLDQKLAEMDAEVLRIQSESENNRQQHNSLIGLLSQLGKAVSAADSQVNSLSETRSRFENELAKISSSLEQQQKQYQQFVQLQSQLQKTAESKDSALADARKRFDSRKVAVHDKREQLAEFKNRETGLTERAQIIEELEKRLEGINAGAKELLQKSKAATSGPLTNVVGLVADLLSVNVQHAGIVDVALGDVAQYVVVDGNDLITLIADEKLKLQGRVGLMQLDAPTTLGTDPNVDLNGAAGVIGRADRLVQVKPQFANFVRQMLGGTWVVKTLGDALQLQRDRRLAVRFVSLDGEVVEADGSVVVGPKASAIGLVSRRSELRALHRDLAKISDDIATTKTDLKQLDDDFQESESEVENLINENTELAAQLNDQSLRAEATKVQIDQYSEKSSEIKSQLQQTVTQLEGLSTKLTEERQQLTLNETQASGLMSLLTRDESNLKTLQVDRTHAERAATTAKVKLAKAEQKLDDLQNRSTQLQENFNEQQAAFDLLRNQIAADEKGEIQAAKEIEEARLEFDSINSSKAEVAELLSKLTAERAEQDAERRKLAIDLNAQRDTLRTNKDKLHESQLQISQLTLQRNQLAERMQEDYGIDIAAVDLEESDEQIEQREQIDAEITALRKKIGQIGSVNVDALTELEELESRYTKMDEQYQDLVEAKETLEKIIVRINADSRKLFVETLQAIRVNFQKLFRQTFGGGQADIILEEGVDPLEAGVEIVATPPGKPKFNNSLLSGGEKALTAVSLLMAIFQFRPSPFCVLDEVDAPFDEANIGRFLDVLRSFLGWTKFVIVTHSKKTMTAATTLYGITMQESGVSKRVSVRFEDVSEDGHISDEALRRAEDDDASAA